MDIMKNECAKLVETKEQLSDYLKVNSVRRGREYTKIENYYFDLCLRVDSLKRRIENYLK